MIPIVEDYLSDLVETKLKYLVDNPNHINKVLGTSDTRIERLKQYLQSHPVRVVKGYPRDPAVLPCICILLSSEQETQEGLGDYGADEDSDVRERTEEARIISVQGGKLAIPYVELSRKPAVSISNILHHESGAYINKLEYDLHSSEKALVGFYTGLVEHGDSVTVTYTYKNTAEEQLRVMYDSNFRLEVWTSNGDLTVELYHILKWALLSGRDHLGADKDLYRQRISGADFEPAPNFFPEFVYRRALSFWCQFSVTIPTEDIPFIESVSVTDSIYFDTEGGD